MRCVVDASVAVAWCLPDESGDQLMVAVLNQALRDGVHVPALWTSEIFNALLQSLRRKRIDSTDLDRAISLLSNLDIKTEAVPDWETSQLILSVAIAQGLTFYDASYLEMAQRLDLPLATRDHKLTTAAKAAGVRSV